MEVETSVGIWKLGPKPRLSLSSSSVTTGGSLDIPNTASKLIKFPVAASFTISSEGARINGLPSRELLERASRIDAFVGLGAFSVEGEFPLGGLLPSAPNFGVPFTSVFGLVFITGVFTAALLFAGVVAVPPVLGREDLSCGCGGVATEALPLELFPGVAAVVLDAAGETFATAGTAAFLVGWTAGVVDVESIDLRRLAFCCGVRVDVGVVDRAGVVDGLVEDAGTGLSVVLGCRPISVDFLGGTAFGET